MGITKRPSPLQRQADVEKFIQAAPDGDGVQGDEKESVQITLRLSKEQLERITKIAKRQGIARASYIKRSVFLQVEADEKNQ